VASLGAARDRALALKPRAPEITGPLGRDDTVKGVGSRNGVLMVGNSRIGGTLGGSTSAILRPKRAKLTQTSKRQIEKRESNNPALTSTGAESPSATQNKTLDSGLRVERLRLRRLQGSIVLPIGSWSLKATDAAVPADDGRSRFRLGEIFSAFAEALQGAAFETRKKSMCSMAVSELALGAAFFVRA